MSRPQTSAWRIQTRSVVRDAARAWNITPPPDPLLEESRKHNLDQDETTLLFTSRCLLEVHTQVDSVRQEARDLRVSQHRSGDDEVETSPISQSSLVARLHDVEERTEFLERAQDIETEMAELRELLSEVKDAVAEMEGTMEEKIGEVSLEIVELDAKMVTRFGEIHAQLDVLSNTMAIQRNAMATRFYATVQPLAIATGDGSKDVQKGVSGKTVAWYWKCHDSKHIDRLISQHELYSIDFRNWFNASSSDSDSDSDSTNLDRPLPKPASVREAVELQPKYAVMALFSCLGLPYHLFEEQTERPRAGLTDRKRGKEHDEVITKGRKVKQRYVGEDGASFSGSPTDVNASPTQSAVSSRD